MVALGRSEDALEEAAILRSADAPGIRQIHDVDFNFGSQTLQLINLSIGQDSCLVFSLQRFALLIHPNLHPNQKGVTKKPIIHFNIDILLNDFMAMLSKNSRQTGQR